MRLLTPGEKPQRMLKMLRMQQSGLSPMRLRALLLAAGFRFVRNDSGRLCAAHPEHPAIIPIGLAPKVMPRLVARRWLDIVEEVLAVRTKEE